jgi:beta-glucosidase-like glycosyl hydrolase/CubicO group peptidase (beta-lactamase class C family)
MTLEQKLGQLVMVFCYGGFTPVESAEFARLARQVEQNHIGGLVIGTRPGALGIQRSQAYPTAALLNEMQRRARIPLLVGADFERGTSFRIEEGTSFPQAMAVAAAGRPRDAYTMGRITALEGLALGIPWVFAPVADVNNNPANPIINIRAFGEDPEKVSAYVAEFVRGVEQAGALATAKHFPGHGDTDADSHLVVPVIRADRARMERVELAPFRAAINAGVSAVMTGHLAVPALEPEPNLPATLSENITTAVLRREMGFGGLVVTDALNMDGLTAGFSPAEAAVRSILAGADVLLGPPETDAALAGLRAAAASGRLPSARIDDAVTRILRAKARLGLHVNRTVNLEELDRAIGNPENARTAQEIADRGVTVLRNDAGLLPLDATRPMRALLVALSGDPDPCPAEALERDLRWRLDALQTVRYDTRYRLVDAVELPAPESYDLMILAMCVRVADRKGGLGLTAEQMALAHRLLETGKPVVTASFGTPYLLAEFPEARTWVAAFSTMDVAQRAASRVIFGQIAATGKLPVTVPEVAAAGAGLNLAAKTMKLSASAELSAKIAPAYDVMERAVADKAFPGGVLAVGYRGELAMRAFGKLSYDAGAAPVTQETIYDAASLTKPVVTAALSAMLAETGQMDVNAPVSRYLPEWNAGSDARRGGVTVRHLLTHTSGLPAHREYFKTAKSRSELVAAATAEPLVAEPGTQTTYSDLGFILLGEILERLTGRPLEEMARERIFGPLGMAGTSFNPTADARGRIAPTEKDDVLRKRVAHGEVHDENAWVMGGASGHAGIFSTAADLAAFSQMMLNGGLYAHQRFLRRWTVAQFTAPEPMAANTRTMGWMTPTPGSTSGRYFSPGSFGHTGFTGTSIWIDPAKELFVVLLSNRVHPTRANDKIQQVRPAVHDAVVEALGLASR